jgi:hypothetical protein
MVAPACSIVDETELLRESAEIVEPHTRRAIERLLQELLAPGRLYDKYGSTHGTRSTPLGQIPIS